MSKGRDLSGLKGVLLSPTAAQMYVDERKGEIGPRARKDVLRELRQLQEAHPGKRLNGFTEADLRDYVFRPHLASGTQAKIRATLINFFEWAAYRGLINRDPAGELRRTKIKRQPSKVHNWLTEEEAAILVKAADDGTILGDRNVALLRVAFLTGLRRHELAGMTWGDVDLQRGTLQVLGKGKKLAVVGLPQVARDALSAWKTATARELGRLPRADEPVFLQARRGNHLRFDDRLLEGKPLGGAGVYYTLSKLEEATGIKVRPHDMRRTFAGWWEDRAGGDLKKVQQQMRHSNVGTTEIYLQQNPRKVVEAGQSLDVAL
jgi:integrase